MSSSPRSQRSVFFLSFMKAGCKVMFGRPTRGRPWALEIEGEATLDFRACCALREIRKSARSRTIGAARIESAAQEIHFDLHGVPCQPKISMLSSLPYYRRAGVIADADFLWS